MAVSSSIPPTVSISPSPRILVIDHDAPILHDTCKDAFPNFVFDLYTSLDQADMKLRLKRYQALITSVRFAGTQDFALLQEHASTQPTAPVIVTVGAADRSLAYRALEQGAFDCIFKPVKKDQAVSSIRDAVNLYQFHQTMAYRWQTLEAFKQQRATLALDTPDQVKRAQLFERGLKKFEETLKQCEQTIEVIESSLRHLEATAFGLEEGARERALARLNVL